MHDAVKQPLAETGIYLVRAGFWNFFDPPTPPPCNDIVVTVYPLWMHLGNPSRYLGYVRTI